MKHSAIAPLPSAAKLGGEERQFLIFGDVMQNPVKLLVPITEIGLPTIGKLDANRWPAAANIKTLPGPNGWHFDPPPRKSGREDLVAPQLIPVNPELVVEPSMERLNHSDVRSSA